jgi:hypothetical protein
MSHVDATFVTGDDAPSLEVTLERDGSVIDLSNASRVTFRMAEHPGATPVVDASAVIADATDGLVRYDWASDDLADAGQYVAELEVAWNDGTTETFAGLALRVREALA